MIRILTLVAVFAAATPAVAMTGSKDKVCPVKGALATVIMTARQNGLGMDRTLEVVTSSGNPWLEKLGRGMTLEAYRMPRFSTDRMKEKSVVDFSNDIMSVCYDG